MPHHSTAMERPREERSGLSGDTLRRFQGTLTTPDLSGFHERVDDVRVELGAPSGLELGDGAFDGACGPVGPRRGHRVEGIGHGKHARGVRYVITHKAIRVSRTPSHRS